jgi:hypothetical protein
MSRETTEARSAARHATERWRQHAVLCAVCSAAKKQRRLRSGACDPEGARLWREMREADRELDRNRELDKRPIAGQETLL